MVSPGLRFGGWPGTVFFRIVHTKTVLELVATASHRERRRSSYVLEMMASAPVYAIHSIHALPL